MAAASLREHGLRIGELEPGPTSGIGDVAGVRVGHVTVRRDEPDPPGGRGVGRSGVTAVVPGDPGTLRTAPVPAGVAVLNGAGEMTGSIAVAEWGVLETPIYLTATMSVGRVFDGAVAAAVAADPAIGVDAVVVPVVAECDDSWLSEARVVYPSQVGGERSFLGPMRRAGPGSMLADMADSPFRAREVALTLAVAAIVLAIVAAVVIWDPIGGLVRGLAPSGSDSVPDVPHLPGWLTFVIGKAKYLLIAVVLLLVAAGRRAKSTKESPRSSAR